MPTSAREIRLATPVRLPKAWHTLWQLPPFGDMAQVPPHVPDGMAPNDSPTPYTQDSRVEYMEDGEFTVEAILMSGKNVYWLDYLVFERGKQVFTGDLDFEVQEGEQEIPLDDGRILCFNVEFR